ncbi:uracil nucleotide/cysteinyl leukotriene receptor [Brachyhypopomus gauderio]|uniref:uracil nucleotide/cysteinyl leukotriene receptor n=1 Tax=Brachyhypopomus gauderio TaxID=698409 RepID=UPI0040435A2F
MLQVAETNISTSTECGHSTAYFQFYLFPITYCLVMVFGLPGNLGALYVFIFKMKHKCPSNAFIISLALADTLFLCVLPFRVHYHLNGNEWVFGDVACRVTGTVFFSNVYVSICFMTCVCVDRYVATVHPHAYLRLRDSRCWSALTAGVWVACGAASLAFMVTSPVDTESHGWCLESFSPSEWESNLVVYSVCSLVFGALVPCGIILVCYPLVARRIARIRTATARAALRVIYAVLAITVLCFLPYHLVHLLHLLRRLDVIRDCRAADLIYDARRVTMALVSLNALLDPVLYYFATGRCRWSLRWLRPKGKRGIYTISDRF